MQHQHILPRPNVVSGSVDFATFTQQLINEARLEIRRRHDPSPISWSSLTNDLKHFLQAFGK